MTKNEPLLRRISRGPCEKAKRGERTFALTADVKEANRQVPVANGPDWLRQWEARSVLRRAAHTWHMLVADDFHLEAGGAEYRPALVVFFVLCTVACPGTRQQAGTSSLGSVSNLCTGSTR